MARTYTDDFRAEALELYRVDGLAATARLLGMSKRTLDSWAHKHGISTEAGTKERTAKACEARDAKRAEVQTELLVKVLELLSAIDAAQGGRECKDLATAVGILIDKLRLEEGKSTGRHEVAHDLSEKTDAELIAEAEAILREAAQ